MSTSRAPRRAAVAFAAALLAASFPASGNAADIERVGDGRNPRAKVGPDGTIHVAASSHEGVFHYRGAGGSWSGGLIAGTDQVGTSKMNQPFIGIAPDGILHLVYGPPAYMPEGFGEPTHGVYYTASSGDGWSTPVNIIDLYTEYLAVETDASGTPYLVALIVLEPHEDPAMRTNYGGATWFREEGEAWNGPWTLRDPEVKYAMLVRDVEGRLHLAFRWQHVHASVYSGGSWHNLPDTGDTFDDILLPGGEFSMSAPHLAAAGDGTLHAVSAACREVSPGTWQWDHVRYAFNDGSGWSEEHAGSKDGERVMDGDINLCSVAIEPTGLVHVFCGDSDANLVHAAGRPGSWSAKEVLDTNISPTVDLPPFDSFFHDGMVHVFYAKSDGVYHLSMEGESEPREEPEEVEEAMEALPEPGPEPLEDAAAADEGEDATAVPDASLDPDGPDIAGTRLGGGCGCVVSS